MYIIYTYIADNFSQPQACLFTLFIFVRYKGNLLITEKSLSITSLKNG